MGRTKRKFVALLATFFLLASLSAHAFNASAFMHELEHERQDVTLAPGHGHFIDAHEPSEPSPMDGMQHLALHAAGDIQPVVIIGFMPPFLAPVVGSTRPPIPSVVPGLPDRDPPFRPPQLV